MSVQLEQDASKVFVKARLQLQSHYWNDSVNGPLPLMTASNSKIIRSSVTIRY